MENISRTHVVQAIQTFKLKFDNDFGEKVGPDELCALVMGMCEH